MSDLLLASRPEFVLLTDADAYYLDQLRSRFEGESNVEVESLRLPDVVRAKELGRHRFDTVVALNVIEHIEDDVGTFRSIAKLLQPGGRAIILVPALPSLFGTLDRHLGHVRRYSRTQLGQRLKEAGFAVDQIFFFNLVGCLGWWLNARVLRSTRIPPAQLAIYDALVPFMRLEDKVNLGTGQSLIAVARVLDE